MSHRRTLSTPLLTAALLVSVSTSAVAQTVADLFPEGQRVRRRRASQGPRRRERGRHPLQRDRRRRPGVRRRQADDGGARRPRHGRGHRRVRRRGDGARPGHRVGAGGGSLPAPGGARAGRRHGRPHGQFGQSAHRRPGDRHRRAVRAQPIDDRRLDQRQMAPEHRLQGHAAGGVLPDGRRDQHGQLRWSDVQHGGRGHRRGEPQHLQGRRKRGARLRGHHQHRQEASARGAVALERARGALAEQPAGRHLESSAAARSATSSRASPRARPPRPWGSRAARSSPPSTESRSSWAATSS